MEDSGYQTRSSTTELKTSGTCAKLAEPDGIFSVSFNELTSNPNYSYLKHGFDDENDFEDFKQELKDFRQLKQKLAGNNLESNQKREEKLYSDTKHLSSHETRLSGIPKQLPERESSFRDYRDCYKELPVIRISNGIATNIRDSYVHSIASDSTASRSHRLGDTKEEQSDPYHGLYPIYANLNSSNPSKSGLVHYTARSQQRNYPSENSDLLSIPCSNLRSRHRHFITANNCDQLAKDISPPTSKFINPQSNVLAPIKSDLKTNLRQCRFSNLARKKLKDDFQDFKLSSLSGLLSRRRRDKSNMEPVTFDDHFQEFERVYETIHSRRTSVDFDMFNRDKSCLIDDSEDDDDIPPKARGLSRFSSKSSLNDVFSIDFDDAFSDFFNTDEDFMEFEREFERSRLNRRSRAINDFKRMSSCDIFSDVKSFCDRNKMVSASGNQDNQLPSPDRYSGQSANILEPVETDSQKCNDTSDINMWNSLEEWDYVLNKLKRNSRLFTDSSEYWDVGAADSAASHSDRLSAESCMCKSSKDCHYTCHQTCVPSVTLDCTSVSPTEVPSTPGGIAAETSLSDRRRNVSPRPQIPSILEEKVHIDQDSTNRVTATTPLLPPPTESEQTLEPAHENDETDSGYRSGTIPDDKLPKYKSEATLNREELSRKVDEYNLHVPSANLEPDDGGETFQGFLKVTLNFIRPITMSLGVRPPSIYEMLTKEHIVEQNTQSIAFYMPRDTVKSIHTSSTTTTKEVIVALLKKFHIIDHPRKFAMYEQDFDGHKIVKLRRVTDKEFPLAICLNWDTAILKRYRLVLQENETGEIVWDGFSLPELNNFMIVLAREENEYISQLQYKYKIMRRIIITRLKELRKERRQAAKLAGAASPTGSSSPSTPRNSSGGFTPPVINTPPSDTPVSQS